MNSTKQRLNRIEKSMNAIDEALPEHERIQLIKVPYRDSQRPQKEQEANFAVTKRKKLSELHEKYGSFSDDSISWVMIQDYAGAAS